MASVRCRRDGEAWDVEDPAGEGVEEIRKDVEEAFEDPVGFRDEGLADVEAGEWKIHNFLYGRPGAEANKMDHCSRKTNN